MMSIKVFFEFYRETQLDFFPLQTLNSGLQGFTTLPEPFNAHKPHENDRQL